MSKSRTSITAEVGVEGSSPASVPLLPLTHSQFTTTSTGSMELVGLRERKPTKVTEFESQYRQPEDKATVMGRMREVVAKHRSKFSCRSLLLSNLPILKALRRYQPCRDLPSDVVAGLTSGIMMIPQAMAFASLSTLQPIIGLYISLFSSLTYFLLGTGQQNSFGCIAILSIMMGSILDKYDARLRQASGALPCTTPLTTTVSFFLINETTTMTSLTSDYSGTSLNVTGTTTTPGMDVAFEDDLEAKKLRLAGGVTLLCGIIFAVLGKVGLGKVTIIMSDSLVTGVTVGAAFHVGSSQLKTIFGLSFLPRQSGIFKLLKLWYSILANIHRSNVASIIASVVFILSIYLVKRFVNEKYKKKLRVPIPIELIVMILGTVVTYYADLNGRYGIGIIKRVPTGVPSPSIPDVGNGLDYLTDGLIIIIVAFVQLVSVAKLMGLKHNYKVDSNQEMFALGMVNIVVSLFSGYISGASISRTVVQDSAGGRSQVASLFAALLVLLVMLFIGPYLYYAPKCALSAIVMVSLRSLMLKLLTVPDMWRKSKVDCVIFLSTVAAVVILDADIGLLVGVVVSIFLVLYLTVRSSVDLTAPIAVGHTDIWRSKERYYGGQEMADVRVVRINTPLYFVNSEIITNAVFKKTGVNPLKTKKEKSVDVDPQDADQPNTTPHVGREVGGSNPTPTAVQNGAVIENVENGEKQANEPGGIAIHNGLSTSSFPDSVSFSTLILDVSGVSFIDLMGVKVLEFLIEKYGSVGVKVYVTNVTENCLDTLERSGFMAKYGEVVLLAVETVLAQISQGQNHARESTKL
ncbi:hypothetical protein ACOMHN_049252 [Nucella lapillus]